MSEFGYFDLKFSKTYVTFEISTFEIENMQNFV